MSEEISPTPKQAIGELIGKVWWVPLLRGILLVIIGGYLLFRPGLSAVALTQVLGIFIIADGLLAIVLGIMGETQSRLWSIVRGLLGILVGIFVFAHSAIVAGLTGIIILYIIAGMAIASGILEIIAAIQYRKEIKGEGWMILSGVLAILFGVIVMIAPLSFGLLIVRILGVYAIMFGMWLIFMAFQVRGAGKRLRE